MFIIKVKSNYGQHEGGRVILRRPQDPPFEIDPDKGHELIDRGIAVLVSSSSFEDEEEQGPDLRKLKVAELRELATKSGIENVETMRKDDLIAALEALESDIPTVNPEHGIE